MIRNFFESNDEGLRIPIELSYPITKSASSESILSFINNPSKKGIGWINNGKEIVIKDDDISIYGLPKVGLDFVVAIYSGRTGEYPPPNNAVVYNPDGSVKHRLMFPPFISEMLVRRINFLKQENPPFSWASDNEGLRFAGFGWRKNNSNEIIDSMSLQLENGSYEIRQVNVATNQFGECLGSALAMCAKH
jgi:hypothetical protein